ncbi:MAG: arginine deiminase family protein [Bacteroidota bacterium]
MNKTIKLSVCNETSELESAILGIGLDRGAPRDINPMMRMHLEKNTYPVTERICNEIDELEAVLQQNGVHVVRPKNVSEIEQIFVRDIGFVIEDYFFISNMRHATRLEELKGISFLFDSFKPDKLIHIPKDITIEGGDVVLWNDFIFLGIGDRTTKRGAAFLQQFFPKKTIYTFDLVTDQNNSLTNVLHLDCTFQPIGKDEAIICMEGFKTEPLKLLELFPGEKLLKITLEQKVRMFPNVFSIAPHKVIIEKGFLELKIELSKRGYEVFLVDYKETSKLNGLFRCSILPLRRRES